MSLSIVTLVGKEEPPEGYRISEVISTRRERAEVPPDRCPRWVIHRTVALERIALVGTPRP